MDLDDATLDGLNGTVALAIGEIYTALNDIEESVSSGSSSAIDAESVNKIKSVAQFLGKVWTEDTNHEANLALQNMKNKLNAKENSEYYRKMLLFSLVEIKCKLGNLQKEVEETRSLPRARFLAQATKAIRDHLQDGNSTHLQLDSPAARITQTASSPLTSSPLASSPLQSSPLQASPLQPSPVSQNRPGSVAASPATSAPVSDAPPLPSRYPMKKDLNVNIVSPTPPKGGESKESNKLKYRTLLGSSRKAVDALTGRLRAAVADMSRFATDEVFELAVVLSELRKIWERENYVTPKKRRELESLTVEQLEKLRKLSSDTSKLLEQSMMSKMKELAEANEEDLNRLVIVANKLRSMRKFLLRNSVLPPPSVDDLRLSTSQQELSPFSLSLSSSAGSPPAPPSAANSLKPLTDSEKKNNKQLLRKGSRILMPQADLSQGICELHAALSAEQKENKLIEEQTRAVDKLQASLYRLNRERHLLALAIRNLDTRISAMIKRSATTNAVGQTNIEDAENLPLESYHQLEQQQNALGAKKEACEKFISLLRLDPQYIASLAKHVSATEADRVIAAITQSLFADTAALASEDYLLLACMKHVLRSEFQNVNNSDAFLRVNSFSTKIISGYCKRQNVRAYLHSVVQDSIIAIMILSKESDLNLEMDPSRRALTLGYISDEAPWDPKLLQEHPDLIERTEAARKKLLVFSKKFLESILNSVPNMPFGLRWIAKTLVQTAKSKFPQLSEEKKYTLLGGFFFLRFIVPAIVSPELHGVHAGKGSPDVDVQTRRNLTMIAKVLQNLANRCQFGEKEHFMKGMNEFLMLHQGILETFYEDMINVLDIKQHFKTINERKLKKIERTVTISPDEIFLLHRLIIQHKDTVVKEDCEAMKEVLALMGPPTAAADASNSNTKYMLLSVFYNTRNMGGSNLVDSSKSKLRTAITKEKLVKLLLMLPTPLCAPPPLAADTPIESVISTLRQAVLLCGSPDAATLLTEFCASFDVLAGVAEVRIRNAMWRQILEEMHAESKERQLNVDFLTTEKLELQQAVEYQQKELMRLQNEKRTHLEYLHNIITQSFAARTKSKGPKSAPSLLGPFVVPLKDLEKLGVVIVTDAIAPIRKDVTFKFSCTSPGCVSMEVKYKNSMRLYELQVPALMDELLQHDTLRYDELTVDLRRLLAYMNRLFGC